MLKRLSFLIFILLLLSALCYSAETQPMNSNELKFKTSDGQVITLTRTNYRFFSMIHQPLEQEPLIIDADSVLLPIIYGQDFAIILAVKQFRNNREQDLMDFLLNDICKENLRTDDQACEMNLSSLTEIPADQLVMGNAAKGYLVYGICDRQKPMKIFSVFGYLQNEDNSKFLKFIGFVSVNPGHPDYNNMDEINQCMYDLKVDIMTARFE